MLHLNFDILDWCSKDYVPALNQSTESLWTSSEPAECFWTCRPPADVSSSGIRPAESSLCVCVADCVAVSLRAPSSPAEATWWPSHFTRTRPTWTRVSPPSTKPLSRLTVRPDLLSFSSILQFLVRSLHCALCSVSDCLLPSISVSRTVPVHQQPVHQHDAALWRLERLWRRQRRGQLQWVRTTSCGTNTTTCDRMFCFEIINIVDELLSSLNNKLFVWENARKCC